MYSARVGLHYRTLGLPREGGVHWFWIGTHAEYDRLVALGVDFVQPPTDVGPVSIAVLDDTCGNLIQIASTNG